MDELLLIKIERIEGKIDKLLEHFDLQKEAD